MKALHLSLTAPSTSADHQALGGRLMRLKEMEDLAAFSVREVKRAAAEERERDEKDNRSLSMRQSHLSELSEN